MTRKLLGLPIAVSDEVELERQLSDEEWNALVRTAQELFSAPGRISQENTARQWANGRLAVVLEPSVGGHRLRLTTLNSHARRMIIGGLVTLGAAATVSMAPTVSGDPTLFANLDGMGVLALIGAAMLGRGVYGLRRWAERRQAQFHQLIERARVPAAAVTPRDLNEHHRD